MPMVTNFGKAVTYHGKPSLKKLHCPSITCFCEVPWQIKYFISPLTLDQWPPIMAKW